LFLREVNYLKGYQINPCEFEKKIKYIHFLFKSACLISQTKINSSNSCSPKGIFDIYYTGYIIVSIYNRTHTQKILKTLFYTGILFKFFSTDRSDKKAYYLVKTKTSFDFKMLINFDYHID